VTPAQHDIPIIILLPGRAFDRSGNRLGRGLGFYDRFLKKLRESKPEARAYGICFHCQLVKKVPTASHDEAVDRVISPEEVVQAEG